MTDETADDPDRCGQCGQVNEDVSTVGFVPGPLIVPTPDGPVCRDCLVGR